MLEFFKNYYPFFNMLVIILGWMVINHQNNRREIRKEIRSALDKIQDLMTDLTTKAIDYHTNKRSKSAEEWIVARASLLSQRTQIIAETLGIDRSEAINQYKNALMEQNFGAQQHPLDDTDELLKKIRHQAQQLSLALEKDFAARYHKTKPDAV